LVDANGEQVKDEYHNPVSFESYIESINPFGTHKVSQQKSPTVTTAQSQSKLRIRSQEEYNDYIRRYPKDRYNAMKAYREHIEKA
jgi:hypothetical protein